MDAKQIVYKIEQIGIPVRIYEGRIEVKNMYKYDDEILKQLKKNEDEVIKLLCERDPSITIPKFTKPYITESGELRIPFDCHPRYKYWYDEKGAEWQPVTKTLSIIEILIELGANEIVIEKYVYIRQKS
ncbi:MAG: hypothetical protein ACYDBT_09775 [Desulfobulbaceae bacterium]